MGKFILGAAIIYLFYCGALFLLQRQMIYPRGLIGPGVAAETVPSGVEQIWLDTTAGRVETWFLKPSQSVAPYPVIIFAHGNAELIDFLPDEFFPYTQLGIGVLLVEYPGYGRSAGSPSEKSIREAMLAAYDAMASRPYIDGQRIVLFGRSLGGGAVCALAARRASAAMILVSSFTSIRAFAKQYLAPAFLVKDRFDNLAVVQNYAKPLLIVHGRHDEVIPFAHGQTLHRAAPQSKLLAYRCGHNDCPPDPAGFMHDFADFLRQAGIIDHPISPDISG